ncbi:rho GTPase-activating protein 21 isoform X3 [Esox lucius]|uniref:rho GTPase-activating protein 21 isoform X3 n=1 Tax=Esox lucius TaxID=8010 RepID=UPI0014777AE4|nr:rho GTPase-activating protein 21 isoform X3 [Esox lucius]
MTHFKVLDCVMNNDWSALCHPYCAWSNQAKQKDGHYQSEASATGSPGGGEEEPFSWPGPKTLRLQRTSQGFGFTLRHFIVYPPESAVHSSLKDEDNGSQGRQRNRLEPMDTIFVKQVKEGGPAHRAGLCTGDRIVKVNGESIIGKTYSQVISLIQNSDTLLELCVMPKDEDILQLFSRDITALAYSQDAYLKGNEAYSGNAQNIPEPPPICYPRIEPKATGMAQVLDPSTSTEGPRGGRPVLAGRQGTSISTPGHTDMGYRMDIPVPPSPPPPQDPKSQTVVCVCNDSVRTVVVPPDPVADQGLLCVARAGPGHRTEENRYGSPLDLSTQPRPLVASGPPGTSQLHHPLIPTRPKEPSVFSADGSRSSLNHPEKKHLTPSPQTQASDTFPSPNSPNHYTPSPSSPATPTRQNIDWRNYTTYKDYIDAKRLHTYGCRTIQERLDSLRAASDPNSAYALRLGPPPSTSSQQSPAGSQVRRRSVSHDRVTYQGATVAPLRSASQEKLGGVEQERTALPRHWPRSASQDALPSLAPIGTGKPRAHSCDYLGRQNEPASVLGERGVGGNSRAELEDQLLLYKGEEVRTSRQGAVLKQLPQPHRTSMLNATSVFTKSTTEVPSRTDSLALTALSRPSRLPVKNSTLEPLQPTLPYTQGPGNHNALDLIKYHRAVMVGNHLGYSTSPLQQLHFRVRADSLQEESGAGKVGLSARSSSCSGPSQVPVQRQQALSTTSSSTFNRTVTPRSKVPDPVQSNGKPVEGPDATVVVLRRNKNSGPLPIRHPSYILAVNDTDRDMQTEAGTTASKTASDCWLPNNTKQEVTMRRLGEQRKTSCSSNLDDSLDSIPFIDEPSSPSIDHDTGHIPASAVISVTPIINTIPPSPISPSLFIRRQLSHDHDSLRFTTIESDSGTKTERSKSYDEGLDNYREARQIPGLKGLRKAMPDKSSEDSGSRRDSSTDFFSDATKEGMLHFRQINMDKSKRVTVGMRSWKQMYAVLRGHYLCLYKDKKDVQANTNFLVEHEPLPISIKACLIDISYSDTKRKNVLRLTTSDCEYLFQAEDREDMLAWIKVIQENSNLNEENADFTSRDLISRKIKEYNTLMSPTGSKTEASPKPSRQSLSIRQTLLGGKGDTKCLSPHSPKVEEDRKNMHKDDTSPPKDKGTWRKGIPGLMRKPFERKPTPGITFGVRLDDCPPAVTNRFVPLIVEVCCNLVEERGLEYTGIYRVPGNNAAISNMQEELNNKGMNDIDIQDDKWRDLNVISSLLKSFFRKLPEPLFTNEKYADFIEANRTEDPVERLKLLKRMLHELPDHHYETIKFLSAHLKTVADNSEKNKMEPRNLAIVFGPTLVRTSEDNMTHMVTHMPDQYKIVETLIQHYDWFFTEEGNGEPVTIVQYEKAVECQPVPNIDHLLTNIGRTTACQGEVSDSTTSDSAKSKGSWGSGKDQCNREHLVSSIFAAANRKRKKLKDKPQPSSSDDDLDSVFLKNEQKNHRDTEVELEPESSASADVKEQAKIEKDNGREIDLTSKGKKEHRPSFFLREKPSSRQPSSAFCSSPKNSGSPSLSYHTAPLGKSSLLDPLSQLDEHSSDLGTMSSGASVPRARPKKWLSGTAAPDLSAAGASAGAEVSSITSDYSTTSSITFLTAADSSTLSPEVQGGDEADDERSELISEGRPMETDSESDFPVFATGCCRQGLDAALELTQTRRGPEMTYPAAVDGSMTPKLEPRRLFPSHRLIECDTLSRRRSLRQKTDSESSVEGGAGSGERADGTAESTRLSRVLEVMKKGQSTGSLSSSSRSETERPPEPTWRLKITERLKFRLRPSADDMFGLGAQKSRSSLETRSKKKNIRRRHTMGGQRDFAELAVINDWREQGGVDQAAELSAMDRLKPKCSSQDFSIRDWIARERCRAGVSEFSLDTPPKAVPEGDRPEAQGTTPKRPSPSSSPGLRPMVGEQVNGSGPQGKSKASLNLAADDAHPHKLSGAQVVRSRFYQYL